MRITVLTAALSLIPWALSQEVVLHQVHVVTRHGSREPLQKSSENLEEGTLGTLTPFGQRQMYDLGVWIHDHYNRTGFLDIYRDSQVRFESSELQRTIASAQALALGVFSPGSRDPEDLTLLPNGPLNVPIYSFDLYSDIWLRSYDKCPVFVERLLDLYRDEYWQEVETENQDFLEALAGITYFHPYSNVRGYVSLEELWNVYDLVQVSKTECANGVASEHCLSIPNAAEISQALTDDEWVQLQRLAHAAELARYGPATAGRLLGSNLLTRINSRMKDARQQSYFYHYSTHYPTILGLFSALGLNFLSDDVLPTYASSLVFEVTRTVSTGKTYFKVFYRGQKLNETSDTIQQLNIHTTVCPDSSLGIGLCPVEALEEYLGDWTDAGKWCMECDNRSAQHCLQYWYSRVARNYNAEEAPPAFFSGLLLGVLVMSCVLCCVYRRHQKHRTQGTPQFQQPEQATSPLANAENDAEPISTDDLASGIAEKDPTLTNGTEEESNRIVV